MSSSINISPTLSSLGGVPTTRTLTINGTAQDLSADRSWTISTGITVGTTAVTSGTDGRVFFQAGGVVQQDANFTFDNTLKRLTLKAVGTASTDIPFQVLNSASTATPLFVRGNGTVEINSVGTGVTSSVKFYADANGAPVMTMGNNYAGWVWHNYYSPYLFSSLDASSAYEGRIDLQRGTSGAIRTRISCTGDSFLQFSNLVIGATTAGARLDVRAQGALSTDIAFRVRNSADNVNIIAVQGDANIVKGSTTVIVSNVQSVTSAATVTPVYGNDLVRITAQAAALTLANPTGTWTEGKDLMIRIKDDGTARAITWDTNYRAIGVTLPTTTVINKTTYVGVIYNSTDSKWDIIGVTTEA